MLAVSAPAGSGSATATSSPTLTEPPGESVPAGGTVTVPGSYTDTFAQANPGAMYLHISDSSGTLSALDTAGSPAAGSGSNSIVVQASYAEISAALHSLSYSAAAPGSDTIRFDVWNQAGQETTGSVAVTIVAASSVEQWTGAVSSDWNNPANWSGGKVPVSGDSVFIFGNTPHDATLSNAVLSGETITLQGSGNSAPTVVFANVTLDSLLQSGNVGTVQLGGTLTVGAQGTVLADANAQLTLSGTSETIINQGLLRSDSGGALWIESGPTNTVAAATLINQGSVVANGGTVNLTPSFSSPGPGASPLWTVQNAGGIDIAQGGGVFLNGTLDGGTVAFNGNGTLSLTQAQAVAGGATITGFGTGDAIDLFGAAEGTVTAVSNGTLEVGNVGSAQAIQLAGSYDLGNFESQREYGSGNPFTIAYAAGGEASPNVDPNILAPAKDSVAQGGTLALGDVSLQLGSNGTINNAATISLSIDAGSGTLYLKGASGSGTSHLSLGPMSATQMNGELAGLSYVPAAGATTDIVTLDAFPNVPVATVRSIPITITAGTAGGTGLSEPSSETVAAGGTVAVGGSYSDSFAAGNPGAMYLHIADSNGTLSATDASGKPVAGSGSNSITLSTNYADINAALHSLTYTAAATLGSDTINFDIWNQAGQETTGSVAMTVSGNAGSGPQLTEPSAETTPANGSIAVGGSYADSFAQSNPGQLYLSIQDNSGTLRATDASGAAVAGTGTSKIGLSTDYVDANAILASLHYTAGGTPGSDTIRFQVWNQAGVETTGMTAVTIDPPAASATLAKAAGAPADLVAAPVAAPNPVVPDHTAAGAGGMLLRATANALHPVILPPHSW